MPVPLPFLKAFLYRQLFLTPSIPNVRFDDQTIIVTGSNVGLGLEAARHFCLLGAAQVILAVRDLPKGEAAKRFIDDSIGQPHSIVEVWDLDLSSYNSVQRFAHRASETLDRIDVVCENAGIATGHFKIAEKDERTMTTNVISTFLLAFLLLPKLKETALRYKMPTTLTITSSEVHHFAKFPEQTEHDIFNALSDESRSDMSDRYFVSKLFEVFCVREMASQAGSSYPVIINCLNPGFCHSQLAREAGRYLHFMAILFARSTEVGSRTIVAAAAAGPETHGRYMSDCVLAEPSDFVRSREGTRVQKKIWAELVAKLEAIEPGITSKL